MRKTRRHTSSLSSFKKWLDDNRDANLEKLTEVRNKLQEEGFSVESKPREDPDPSLIIDLSDKIDEQLKEMESGISNTTRYVFEIKIIFGDFSIRRIGKDKDTQAVIPFSEPWSLKSTSYDDDTGEDVEDMDALVDSLNDMIHDIAMDVVEQATTGKRKAKGLKGSGRLAAGPALDQAGSGIGRDFAVDYGS